MKRQITGITEHIIEVPLLEAMVMCMDQLLLIMIEIMSSDATENTAEKHRDRSRILRQEFHIFRLF